MNDDIVILTYTNVDNEPAYKQAAPLHTLKGKRYDWGFVERDLRNGKEVRIIQVVK